MKKQEKGSITVFLIFILLLLLALIGTIIDVGRVQVAESYVYRGLINGMETEFSKYCKELYEDYHLFMRERKLDSEQLSEEAFVESVRDYMIYGLRPSAEKDNLEKIENSNLANIIDMSVNSCKATEITGILDYKSELVQSQIIDYMKYRVTSEEVGNLLQQMKLLEKSKSTIEVVQKKIEVEESVSALDEKILELIEEIEGISFDKGSFSIDPSLEVKVQDSFVKQFCVKKIRASNVGIPINVLWDALRGKYINPVIAMEEMLSYYEQEIMDCKTKKEILEKMKSKEFKDIFRECEMISKMTTEVMIHINQAMILLNEIERTRSSLQEKVMDFSSYLKSQEKKVNSEVYKGIQEEYQQVSEYVKKDKVIGDIEKIKTCLQTNREILEAQRSMEQLLQQCSDGEWDTFYKFLLEQIERYKEYSIEPLTLDYSGLQVKEEVINPITTFSKVVKEGFTSLVLDSSEELSKEKVLDADLPSNSVDKEEDHLEQIIEQVEQQDTSEKEEVGGGIYKEFTMVFKGNTPFTKGTEEVAKKMLLIQYGVTKFNKYEGKEVREKELPTKLLYEQEYLVAGKRADVDNIRSVIRRTVFIRTVMNYVSLLADSNSRKEAQVVAAGLVGFTGIQPLVSVTKQLILITWAMEEATVDTRALLLAKKVPFMKSAKSFSISIKEMILFSKQLIQQKAVEQKEEGSLAMGYSDYIKCYLLLIDKDIITYRMLDLIQMNMRVRYHPNFSLQHGMFGVTMKASIELPGKMLHLPFIEKFSGYDGTSRTIEVVAGYSY